MHAIVEALVPRESGGVGGLGDLLAELEVGEELLAHLLGEDGVDHGDVDLQVAGGEDVEVEGADGAIDVVDGHGLGVQRAVLHLVDADALAEECRVDVPAGVAHEVDVGLPRGEHAHVDAALPRPDHGVAKRHWRQEVGGGDVAVGLAVAQHHVEGALDVSDPAHAVGRQHLDEHALMWGGRRKRFKTGGGYLLNALNII